jgi:hypothetical protein
VVAALGAGGVLATVLSTAAENYALLLRPVPVKLPGGGAGQPSNQ